MVYRKTLDLSGNKYGWPGIRGKTLEILQELMKYGYILCSNFHAGHKYHILRKYFPNICKIHIHNKTIMFLEDKSDVAARAFLSNMDKKIMSFQELKQVTTVFGIELTTEEKHRIIGKPRKYKLSAIHRKESGFLSSYSESQMKLDDFYDKNGFPHNFLSVKSQKNHRSNKASLPKDDDSLIDFYIRINCALKIQRLQELSSTNHFYPPVLF